METYPTIPKRPCSVFAPSISGHVTLFFRCLSIPIYVAEINLKSSYLKKLKSSEANDFREFQRRFGDSVWKNPQNVTYFEAIFLGCFSTNHGVGPISVALFAGSPGPPGGPQVAPWRFQRTSRWGRRTACFPGRCLGSSAALTSLSIMIVMNLNNGWLIMIMDDYGNMDDNDNVH